ncbi:MAG: hypothetical protein LBU79_08435 [Planctomycetota bacterium]|jgi:hypothetical protein|nr:hypothetical protein [Planctomycetota bacterium]
MKPSHLLLTFLLLSPILLSGEETTAQPYEKIRYPTFVDGRLNTLLEADKAEAFEVAEGTPRVNLQNVIITLYDQSAAALAATPQGSPLPVKMTITSDHGYFTRRPPEPGAPIEEIANLEGNVVLRRYRTGNSPPPITSVNRRRRLPPELETEVHCQHAQWNNTLRKMNGDGEVEFIQEDSRIIGTGFLYLADDEVMMESTGASGNSIREWGGIIFIEHNARMEIERENLGGAGAYGRTVITCKDTASYKLREREVQFEREVKINRPGLMIESDILQVLLRREDDLETKDSTGPAPIPGMVRSIIATIGKRPGSVVITGFELTNSGEGAVQYVARGGRADFDYDANSINLTDSRLERVPEVEFGNDRISDRNLDFTFASTSEDESSATPLEELNASGGQGMVTMRPRPRTVGGAAIVTEVSYKGSMRYLRPESMIRFRDSIFLQHGDLRIRSEFLDIRLQDGLTSGSAQVRNITAETDVEIRTGNREAQSHRAEYEFDSATGLDTLRLFGLPSRTPPHPWIRDDEGNQITAPTIVMHRLQGGGNQKDKHLLTAADGTIVCDFITSPDNLSDRGKVISVKCERAMEYNEAKRMAWFEEQVMATSDAPEDNYVLTSDRLEIYLVEKPDPNDPSRVSIRPRRIDANGNARLMQDTRVCEANQIIRDFPSEQLNEGDIYLEGSPARNGRPPEMAIYREQDGDNLGSMFTAPRIKAAAIGNLIQANGPGELSIPDEIPGFRSEIDFEGAARYESYHDGLVSEAKFRTGVVLRQPSKNLVMNSEELDARFLQKDTSATTAGTVTIPLERIGNIRRAEARVGVKIEHGLPRQGRRIATGDRGVVEFTESGNVITLAVDRRLGERRWVMARDHDGMTLWAPEIEVRQEQGVTRAAGPGELRVPGDSSSEGMNRIPTRVAYGEKGTLIYNELALNIRATDNVRILQPSPNGRWETPSLDGRCDRLEIILLEPPEPGMGGTGDALSRVLRMDATGSVLLRVYADPVAGLPETDWMNRPGTTFFTRGDQAVYDVPEGRITMSALTGRQPQLLLNVVEDGLSPRRQRMRADRFVLNTNSIPRRWYFEGQLESSTLRPGEPFGFID